MYIGNHTFAVIKGAEEYVLLKEGLSPVLRQVNDLIEGHALELQGTIYELNVVLGGDYKVLHVYGSLSINLLNLSIQTPWDPTKL